MRTEWHTAPAKIGIQLDRIVRELLAESERQSVFSLVASVDRPMRIVTTPRIDADADHARIGWWWSDGMRLVAVLSEGDTPPQDAGRLGWDPRPPWF